MIVAITNAEAKYVAAAYGIVFLVVLLYVLIISLKLARLEREASELTEQLRARRVPETERERVPVG
ncbi:MAG TPA: CcmD family protein [Gaiellaceae bacterium]